MKREFLKNLGIADDLIDKIMAENGKDVQAEKDKAAKVESDLAERDRTIETYKTQVSELQQKVGDNADIAKQLKDLQDKIAADTDGLPDFVKDALGLKGGSNIHVDLGSSQLLGDTKPNAGKEDATVRELKKVNRSIVQGDKANLDALQWFDTAENFLQSVIDANGGTEYAVNKQGGDITDAVKGSGGTGVGEGEKTAYDVVTELMNQWNPGTYDDNLAKEIQSALDLLQVHDQWIHNAELIDTGEIPPEVAEYLKKHSADEVYKQIDEQGLKNTITGVPDGLATDTSIQGVADAVEGKDLTVENEFDTTGLAKDESVQGVTGAVNGKNWSPTIEAPALDPAPIASAISNVKVEPSIKATVRIPEIEVPEANVDVAVDTSILDTSATNLSGSADNLDTSADNLDTSATNLSSLATPQDILQAYEGTRGSQNKWGASAGKVPGQKGAQQQGGALQTVQQISVPEIPAVPDEVLESYQNLVTAIQNLNTAFQNLMSTLSGGGIPEGAGGAEGGGGEAASAEGAAGGAGSSLTEVLSGLPGLFDKVQAAAQTLASYFTGEFIASINTMLEILCVTSTDEEGNIDAGGGNTLYTAMGSIYGLFRDTFVTTQDLGNYWSSTFVGQINTLREQCGIGKSATQGLADAASTAATAYANLAGAIMMAVSALQELNSVKNGGAGKINPSPGTSPVGPEGAAANGAHVRAGETWLVGEEGPELFTPHRDGYIIPNDELRGGSRTMDDRPINITIEGSVYGESYLKNYVVNTLTTTVKKELRLAAA